MTLKEAVGKCSTQTNRRWKGHSSIKSGLCSFCSNTFFTTQTAIFCSMKCAGSANSGTKHSQWKGGRSKSPDGYMFVLCQVNGKSLYRREHVVVMEKHLGRKLKPGENIHHINGIKDDNRIINLELWVTHQPKGQRVNDLINFVIDNYEQEVRSKLRKV